MSNDLVAVVGATASGKSDLGIRLAEQIGGEVVNADAMQLYRGMAIGTAKLSLADRRGIPHHLLDVLDVSQAASVAEYQGWARCAVREVWRRGRVPILVGGSGLYVRSVLDEMEFPGTDPELRSALEEDLERLGPTALHDRLRAVDPVAADAILPSNGRRVVRALEVVSLTGRPFAASLPSATLWHEPTLRVAIDVDRDVVDARVAGRVDHMWSAGLVDEVRRLERRGLREGRTAGRALGYAQVLGFLDGRWTESEAKAHTVTATRRFVRRQDSWFRRDDRVRWLDPDRDLVRQVARRLGR